MAPSIVTNDYSFVMTGRGKFERTPEMRAAASAARQGRRCPEGCTCKRHTSYERTPETRAKNAEAMRGRKQPEEAIAKRTATRKAKGTLVTHGHGSVKEGRTPTYTSWENMIQRCTNPNSRVWKYYGGRGITVCERWREFKNFLADMGERPEGMTLDRINNDGNYEPGNVRWTDWETQNTNRRRSAYYDRPSRVPDCGHAERPHKARGMCGACYFRWRVGSQKKDVDGRVKLTEENVAWIKANAGALSQRAMARALGVSPSTISMIQSGKRRADL
jgi:hypothetical protein